MNRGWQICGIAASAIGTRMGCAAITDTSRLRRTSRRVRRVATALQCARWQKGWRSKVTVFVIGFGLWLLAVVMVLVKT